MKKIAHDSADADITLVGRNETSAGAKSSILPLPPVGKAVEDTDPPTGAPADALQVPEVGTRIATAASVLLIRGATTATALAASDAQPVTASRPLEVGIKVGSDELKDRLGRDFRVHEQSVVLHCGVRRGPNWPRVGSTTDFRSHAWRTPRRNNVI
jgi:hypothetical protein